MKIKITADSTCDLNPEQISRYNIRILPLYIVKDDTPYKDGVEIKPEDIFDYVDSGKGICHTSAINVDEYINYFSEYAEEYDAVIHIDISSEFSACNQSANIAAAEFKNVYVVDSRNLSTGSGHLVLDAAIMAESGMDAEDIVKKLQEDTERVEASFVIDTLKYLHKGGRCSGVAALGANVLKLKPCIEVKDGKMEVGKKYRGNFDKVIIQYVTDRLAGRNDIDTKRIFITYASGVKPETVAAVKDAIIKNQHFDEICESFAGCTVSNHCGPVCLGVLFYRK